MTLGGRRLLGPVKLRRRAKSSVIEDSGKTGKQRRSSTAAAVSRAGSCQLAARAVDLRVGFNRLRLLWQGSYRRIRAPLRASRRTVCRSAVATARARVAHREYRRRGRPSADHLEVDADPFVDDGSTLVAGEQPGLRLPYCGSDECVVDAAAGDSVCRRLRDQLHVGARRKRERRISKAIGQKGGNERHASSMGWRKPGEDRVSLDENVRRDAWLPCQDGGSAAMPLVPGGKCGNHDTRID